MNGRMNEYPNKTYSNKTATNAYQFNINPAHFIFLDISEVINEKQWDWNSTLSDKLGVVKSNPMNSVWDTFARQTNIILSRKRTAGTWDFHPFFQRNIIFQTFNFGFKMLIFQGAGWFSHHKNLLLSSSPNGTSSQQLLGMSHPKPPRMSVKASYTRVILVESRNNDLANGGQWHFRAIESGSISQPHATKIHVVPGKSMVWVVVVSGPKIQKILRWMRWYSFQ